jgi:diguanylate cyclase (GGDEF)-like protein/PAS domain S-box-containing protein
MSTPPYGALTSRELARLLYEACPDAVVVIDDKGTVLFANPAMRTLFGYDPEEVIGQSLTLLQPERLREAHRRGLARYLATGERTLDWNATQTFGLHRDGHEFPVEIAFTAIAPRRFDGLIRDVSKRVEAERALEASEARYRELVDNANDIVYATDLLGNFTFANAAAARTYGYTLDELMRLNIRDLVDPDHLALARQKIMEKVAGTDVTLPYPILTHRKDGTAIWVEVSTRLVRDEAGAPAWIQGTARDITARREAEDQLARARDFRDRVMESTTNAIGAFDVQGRLTLVNKRLCEMTGYGEEELIGQRLGPLLIPGMDPEATSVTLERVMKGEIVDSMEFSGQRKDGSQLVILASMRPMKDGDRVVGVVGVAEDITERKRAEEALRESEARYRQMFESNSAVRALVDPETQTIVEANEAACAYYGYSREELTGMAITRIATRPAQELTPLVEDAAAGRQTFIEGRHRLASGEIRNVEMYVGTVDVRSHRYLMCTVFDVTERVRAEARLAEQSRLLEEKSALLESALAAERERARRDPLTAALNHAVIAQEVRRLIDDPDTRSFALAMVDVDGLKAVNDTYGHQVGDAVLLAVASALRADGAIVGRYGGDEFVAILPGADREVANAYRQRVIETLTAEDLRDPDTGSRIQIDASIGLAIYPEEGDAVEDLIKLSDSAMYASRRQRADVSATTAFARIHGGERAAEIVGEIVPFLTSPGELQEKLNLVAARVSAGAGYDGVNFTLYGTAGPSRRTASFAANAEAERDWDAESMPQDEPGPMRMLLEATRRPVIIDDVQTSDFTTPEQRDILRAVGIQSGLVVPMIWRGQLVGALSVGSKRPAAFGPRDAQFLSAIATQVTSIVRTAALVDDLQAASDRLLQAQTETVLMLAAAAEAHDDTTVRHLQRVRGIAQQLALELGHSEPEAKEIGLAAVLHDIGKIRVPDYVLASSASLSDTEWALMKEHTIWGGEFLGSRGGFEMAMQVARSHHERWDGSGYPDGLAGPRIPEAAAITSVADSLDAMISDRPYRAGRPLEDAIAEVEAWSGRQFSPAVVEALLALYRRGELAYLGEEAPATDALARRPAA